MAPSDLELLGGGVHQQADFPVAGVIAERDRGAIGGADAAVGAEDEELLAAERGGIPAHAGVLGPAEEVAGGAVEQHFGRDGQRRLAGRALWRAHRESRGRRNREYVRKLWACGLIVANGGECWRGAKRRQGQGRKNPLAHAPAESRRQPRLAAPQVFHQVSRAEGPCQQTANFRHVNPVTDGAGMGSAKTAEPMPAPSVTGGGFAFSRESPVLRFAGFW